MHAASQGGALAEGSGYFEPPLPNEWRGSCHTCHSLGQPPPAGSLTKVKSKSPALPCPPAPCRSWDPAVNGWQEVLLPQQVELLARRSFLSAAVVPRA